MVSSRPLHTATDGLVCETTFVSGRYSFRILPPQSSAKEAKVGIYGYYSKVSPKRITLEKKEPEGMMRFGAPLPVLEPGVLFNALKRSVSCCCSS